MMNSSNQWNHRSPCPERRSTQSSSGTDSITESPRNQGRADNIRGKPPHRASRGERSCSARLNFEYSVLQEALCPTNFFSPGRRTCAGRQKVLGRRSPAIGRARIDILKSQAFQPARSAGEKILFWRLLSIDIMRNFNAQPRGVRARCSRAGLSRVTSTLKKEPS